QEAAAREFRAVLRQAPDYPPAHYQLGLYALRREDWAGAAAELETALKLAPGFKEAAFNLARAYDRLGRTADARQMRDRFVRLTQQEQQILDLRTRIGFGGGDTATYLRLARAYRAAGQPDRAAETLVSGLQRAPGDRGLKSELQSLRSLAGQPAAHS